MKKNTRIFALMLCLSILSACGGEAPPQDAANTPPTEEVVEAPTETTKETAALSFTDAAGNQITLEATPEKVVSCIGSYAEMWELAGGTLVGVTNDAVTENRVNNAEALANVGLNSEPNTEEILALQPDFVILSPNQKAHQEVSQVVAQAGIPYAFFDVENFEDYLEVMKIFTDITGREDLYQQNTLAIKDQIDGIIAKCAQAEEKPTVLFIRAFSTGAKAKGDDNMTGKMLADLGVDNIAARHESLLEEVSMEAIIAEDPDYIFVVTMGSSSEKALEGLRNTIEANPAWNTLKAVQEDHYIVLPKELFHFKPNAKWGEAYEYLAEILYPELFTK